MLKPGGLLFAYEPCSLRAGPAGVRSIPDDGPDKEFRFSIRLARRAASATPASRSRTSARGCLAVRVLGLSLHRRLPAARCSTRATPSTACSTLVPGLESLSEQGLIRARKPA